MAEPLRVARNFAVLEAATSLRGRLYSVAEAVRIERTQGMSPFTGFKPDKHASLARFPSWRRVVDLRHTPVRVPSVFEAVAARLSAWLSKLADGNALEAYAPAGHPLLSKQVQALPALPSRSGGEQCARCTNPCGFAAFSKRAGALPRLLSKVVPPADWAPATVRLKAGCSSPL